MAGFIDKKEKREFVKKLDELIELDGFAEKIDGVILAIIVDIIDKKTPEKAQEYVKSFITAFNEG